MRRREFIGILGGAAAAWPLPARAQQAQKIPRIGWIILGSPSGGFADIFSYYDSFSGGLGDLGYVDGRNITLLTRSALGVPEALPGEVPDPAHPPAACRFHPRCPYAFDRCSAEDPVTLEIDGDRTVACWLQAGGGPPARPAERPKPLPLLHVKE